MQIDPIADVDRVTRLRHDVMNPLTVILGYAKLLMSRDDLPEDVFRQVSRIQDEARRCIEIFDADKVRNQRGVEDDPVLPEGPSTVGAAVMARVLVVDDEETLRTLSSEVIRSALVESGRFGTVNVFEAATPGEALDIAEKNGVDVVVMDLNIGRAGGGLDLMASLERLAPGVSRRSVFVSGGILNHESQVILDRLNMRLLKKPFGIDELASLVLDSFSR